MNPREPVSHTGAIGLPAMELPRGRHRRRAPRHDGPGPRRPRRPAWPAEPAAAHQPLLRVVRA